MKFIDFSLKEFAVAVAALARAICFASHTTLDCNEMRQATTKATTTTTAASEWHLMFKLCFRLAALRVSATKLLHNNSPFIPSINVQRIYSYFF